MGDVLVAIDGVEVLNLPHDDIVKLFSKAGRTFDVVAVKSTELKRRINGDATTPASGVETPNAAVDFDTEMRLSFGGPRAGKKNVKVNSTSLDSDCYDSMRQWDFDASNSIRAASIGRDPNNQSEGYLALKRAQQEAERLRLQMGEFVGGRVMVDAGQAPTDGETRAVSPPVPARAITPESVRDVLHVWKGEISGTNDHLDTHDHVIKRRTITEL